MAEGWLKTTLGDVAHIQQGKMLSVSDMSGGEHPVYGANGIIGWYDVGNTEVDVVALGCRGSCGTVHLAPSGSFLANNVMAVWPRSEAEMDVAFLALILETADFLSSGVISGQVQPQITRRALAPMGLLLPPYQVQRRIVDLIAHHDEHVAHLQVEALRSAALVSALRDEVLGELEADRPLEEVLDTARSGGTPSRTRSDYFGGNIPWLKSGEVDNAWIRSSDEGITEAGLAGSSAWLVPAGSVVVAMYGQGDTKGTAGYLVSPMSTNQAVLALVPNPDSCDGRFLLHWMRWHTEALRVAATGAAQPNLSKGIILREVRFPSIPVSQQEETAGLLDVALDASRKLELEARKVSALRDGLLELLLLGQIEIPDSYDQLLLAA